MPWRKAKSVEKMNLRVMNDNVYGEPGTRYCNLKIETWWILPINENMASGINNYLKLISNVGNSLSVPTLNGCAIAVSATNCHWTKTLIGYSVPTFWFHNNEFGCLLCWHQSLSRSGKGRWGFGVRKACRTGGIWRCGHVNGDQEHLKYCSEVIIFPEQQSRDPCFSSPEKLSSHPNATV